jgi:penicillin-binding protein 2
VGSLKIGNRVFKDWTTHGRVNLYGAIAHSCDVYFYTAGLATGRDRIVQFAKDFGLNQRTQIDLPNETYGLVPEIDWFKRAHNRPWSQGDTANISIGQGDLLVTPIGLNVMTMALANGGIVYKPFVLKKVLSNSTVPRFVKQRRSSVRSTPPGTVSFMIRRPCTTLLRGRRRGGSPTSRTYPSRLRPERARPAANSRTMRGLPVTRLTVIRTLTT